MQRRVLGAFLPTLSVCGCPLGLTTILTLRPKDVCIVNCRHSPLGRNSTPDGLGDSEAGMGVGVSVGVADGVGVIVGVAVPVVDGVAVGVSVGVADGVGV